MSTEEKSLHFIEQIIEENLTNGFPQNKLRFRFPPEPNGYLHIGHAKSICLNFGLGLKYNAPVNLRFDDTNPAKEEQEYVDAIKEDLQWLGFQWDKELYASDYFQQLYDWAIHLINNGKAEEVLCGWINCDVEDYEAFLYLVSTEGSIAHNKEEIIKLYTTK